MFRTRVLIALPGVTLKRIDDTYRFHDARPDRTLFATEVDSFLER
jgi:hypothetical protein